MSNARPPTWRQLMDALPSIERQLRRIIATPGLPDEAREDLKLLVETEIRPLLPQQKRKPPQGR